MTRRALTPVMPAILSATLLIAGLSSCDNQPPQNDTSNRKAVAPADSAAGKKATGNNMAITLPVLDALFYEEGFEAEIKSKLGLKDAQVEKLKTVSRESVAELAEDGVGDYSGSGRAAVTQADAQMRGVIGDDKAAQLYELVGKRYAGGDIAGLMPTKPNAVPTDTRIVINAPAYRMDVFQDGKLTNSYRVGIGYPEFPLPTGMRRAETIIFNPTWTPPDEPWVKGKFKPGQKVDAGSKDNPLGPLKIPIGAPSLIHGGKAVAKLGGFASHGCVGLTNDGIKEFALIVAHLAGSGLTADSINDIGREKGSTKNYRLPKPVPVELRYETIVGENGGLRVYRDVYERGTNTVEAAKRVLELYGVSYESLPAPEKQALLAALTEMNRDPKGAAIIADAANPMDTTSSTKAPDSGSVDGVPASKVERSKKGKETRIIVGRKEVAVPIAALNGKGYPAPVNFNTGVKTAAR